MAPFYYVDATPQLFWIEQSASSYLVYMTDTVPWAEAKIETCAVSIKIPIQRQSSDIFPFYLRFLYELAQCKYIRPCRNFTKICCCGSVLASVRKLPLRQDKILWSLVLQYFGSRSHTQKGDGRGEVLSYHQCLCLQWLRISRAFDQAQKDMTFETSLEI